MTTDGKRATRGGPEHDTTPGLRLNGKKVCVVGEADVSMTEEFGDYSDSLNITLETLPERRILLRFPGFYW